MEKSLIAKKDTSTNLAKKQLAEFETNQELNRIIKKNERLSYRSRLKGVKGFVMVALMLLLLWSATTESLFLYAGFYEMTSSAFSAVVAIIVFVLLLEGGKYFFGTYLLLFLTHGWIKDGRLYVLTFLVLLPLTIGLYWGSFYLSVNGAPKIAAFVKTNTSTLPLIDTDSINLAFDTKIMALQAEIDSAKSIKWKGTTTGTATKLALEFQAQINQLENQKHEAIKLAQTTNSKQIEQSDNNTKNWGGWLSSFGGYGEILTIIFLLFLELYDRASYLELPVDENDEIKDVNDDDNNTTEDNNTYSNDIEHLVNQAVAGVLDTSISEEDFQIEFQKVDTRYLKQRAKQCFNRSMKTTSTSEARQRNLQKALRFIQELSKVGVKTQYNSNANTGLTFSE